MSADPALTQEEGHSGTHPPDIVTSRIIAEIRYAGPARKVSISMPEDLAAAVQQRVGRGKFSQYVTEAVARRLELDLLADLSGLLAAKYGPIPEEYLAEARAAWPDNE
jgi:hypothetical protein